MIDAKQMQNLLEQALNRIVKLEQKVEGTVDPKITNLRHALIAFLENPKMDDEARKALLTMLR